jgi:hypothetical protein
MNFLLENTDAVKLVELSFVSEEILVVNSK